MKLLPAACLFAMFAAAPAFAEEAAGKWSATSPSGATTIFLTLAKADDGAFTGYLESPTQTPLPIPLQAIKTDGQKLSFSSNAMHGAFAGAWDETKKMWSGEWRQHGKVIVMEFVREAQ
jgi:hypothetical protein